MKAVVVVVPIRNEEELLGRCIAALAQAVEHNSTTATGNVQVAVTLVLDSCTDTSAVTAHASALDVLSVDFNNVGRARSAGIDRALQLLEPTDLTRVWIANTDADSAVPPNWLSCQLALARIGVEVMIGTVRPDPKDLDSSQRAAWAATHVPGEANGHVHGANLGCTADAYRAVGGFRPLSEHEDVRLVEDLRAASARCVATDDCWVLTSGRPIGRTAGGYAGYIRQQLTAAAAQRPVQVAYSQAGRGAILSGSQP